MARPQTPISSDVAPRPTAPDDGFSQPPTQCGGSPSRDNDQGNRYGPSGTNHIRGMGVSQRNRADASFALRPGEAREATFQVSFRPGRAVLGTTYTFDFAVEELEILPRNQLRTAREFAVGFRDLALGVNPADIARRALDALRGRRP